jgi:hypothetical protein
MPQHTVQNNVLKHLERTAVTQRSPLVRFTGEIVAGS